MRRDHRIAYDARRIARVNHARMACGLRLDQHIVSGVANRLAPFKRAIDGLLDGLPEKREARFRRVPMRCGDLGARQSHETMV